MFKVNPIMLHENLKPSVRTFQGVEGPTVPPLMHAGDVLSPEVTGTAHSPEGEPQKGGTAPASARPHAQETAPCSSLETLGSRDPGRPCAPRVGSAMTV